MLNRGKSTVTADFGAGTVNVKMTDFSKSSGIFAHDSVDTITVTGMKISANTFSGGRFETLKNGAAVDLTGANTTTSAHGTLFGYDATARPPDEVGGYVSSTGQNGNVGAILIAD